MYSKKLKIKILGKIKKAKELDIKLPEDAFYYGVANKPSTPVKKVISRNSFILIR